MKKFPLNQKGIQRLQQYLYVLSDIKLAIEVSTLRSGFIQWLKTKFDLTNDELAYLNQLNKHFIEYLAINSSNFLAERKPIYFMVFEFEDLLTESENI